MKGIIIKNVHYSVICDKCKNGIWHTADTEHKRMNKKDFVNVLKNIGWRINENGFWVHPDCIETID